MSRISGTIDVQGDIQVDGMLKYSVYTQSVSSNDDIYLDGVHTLNITHSVRILLPDLTLPRYEGVTYSISKNTADTIFLISQNNNTIYYNGVYKELSIKGGTNVLNIMNINGKWTLTSSKEIPVASKDDNRNMILMGKGGEHTIGVSHDGENIRLLGKDVFTVAGHGVTYNNNGMWVGYGCGANTLAYTIDNGVNWVQLGNNVFSLNCYDVGYDVGSGLWVAVGEGVNSMAYSHDGITWIGLGTSIFQTLGTSVSSKEGFWVACGKGGNTVAYSPDGKVWTGLGAILSSCGMCVGKDNGVWYVVGEGTSNVLKWSLDGVVWSPDHPHNGVGNSTDVSLKYILQSTHCMTRGIDKWVAVGSGSEHTMAYSMDGSTWIGLGKQMFSVKGVGIYYSFIHFKWFAFGEGGHTSAHSIDGVHWTEHNDVFDISGFSMSTRCQNQSIPGEVYVAVGKGDHTICCSVDGGITYRGLGTRVFGTQGFDIHKNGDTWVAMGEGGNTIAYSNHGCIWKGLGSSIFTTRGRCVTYFNDKWVATGQGSNTLAHSSDGTSWIPLGSDVITNSGLFIASNSSICVVVGAGVHTMAYSTNGLDWTVVENVFQSFGSYVMYSDSSESWYAFGDGGVVYTSSNGQQWSNIATTLSDDACMLNLELASGDIGYFHDKKWVSIVF
jgi:hypothetical protein